MKFWYNGCVLETKTDRMKTFPQVSRNGLTHKVSISYQYTYALSQKKEVAKRDTSQPHCFSIKTKTAWKIHDKLRDRRMSWTRWTNWIHIFIRFITIPIWKHFFSKYSQSWFSSQLLSFKLSHSWIWKRQKKNSKKWELVMHMHTIKNQHQIFANNFSTYATISFKQRHRRIISVNDQWTQMEKIKRKEVMKLNAKCPSTHARQTRSNLVVVMATHRTKHFKMMMGFSQMISKSIWPCNSFSRTRWRQKDLKSLCL